MKVEIVQRFLVTSQTKNWTEVVLEYKLCGARPFFGSVLLSETPVYILDVTLLV